MPYCISLTNFVALKPAEVSLACDRGLIFPRSAEFTELTKLDLPAPANRIFKLAPHCQSALFHLNDYEN